MAKPGGQPTQASAKPKPKAQSGPGPRIALRNWRISTRLVSLLALPVVAATTLGGLRINSSLDDIQQLDNMKLLTDMTKQATELAAALEEERDQSAGPLAHGASDKAYDVAGPRAKTERALKAFRDEAQKIDDADNKGLLGVHANLVQITGQLDDLQSIRKDAFDPPASLSQTVDSYSQLIQQLLTLSEDMAQATSNPEMIQRVRALAAFSSAKEYASVQRAVIAAALPPNGKEHGHLTETDRRYGSAAYEKYRSELDIFSGIYQGDTPADKLLKPIDDTNPTIQEADNYAQHVLQQSNGMQIQDKRSYKDWVDADSTKILAMSKIEMTLLDEMEQRARELRNESEREAIISGALIVLVLGVSLVGAFIVARSMIRSLRRLQDTATKVAQDRLPELVRQLSESDPQDVDSSVESVGVHSRDEIGKVAAAFDDVHREAVRLAAEQALLRGNVNAMFTNLSRRSQGLIQRQLSLISELESREADPDQLSSLFKLDHLATRMRRNGENLLVLAGEEPGRRWTRPVPLVDVLRAAASEVEQYERIELAAVPATEVAGRVVNDLVHLLAELLENATSFSSPQTKVKVTGHALPDGRVLVEIHDTGIGLSPEDLASINERLAAPPTVDVSVSRRMGLFVVGRLSQRHGIRIQLRPSDSGGTTALVMLPVDVAQGGRRAPGKGGAPSTGGPAAAQAAAGAAAARRSMAAGSPGGPSAGGAPGRLETGAPRGQMGAGPGARAALPSREVGPGVQRPGPGSPLPGDPQAPAAPQPGSPVSASAFGQDSGMPSVPSPGGIRATGRHRDGFSDELPGTAPNAPRSAGPSLPAQRTGDSDASRRPELPMRGGVRAELPGGSSQPTDDSPSVPGWGGAQPPSGPDTVRGHEESGSLFARPDDRMGAPQNASTGQFPAFGDDRQGPGSTAEIPRIDDRQGPGSTAEIPRIDDRQGPGSTGQFARPDFNAPRPDFAAPQPDRGAARPDLGAPQRGAGGGQDTGQYGRQDLFGGSPAARRPDDHRADQDAASTGQFAAYDDRRGAAQDGSTGQFTRPDYDAGRPGAPQETGSIGQFAQSAFGNRPPGGPESAGAPGSNTGDTGPFTAPQFDRGRLSMRPTQRAGSPADQDSLPPATGPGDGRTPLYDTLETNWFRGGRGSAPSRPPSPPAGSRPGGGAPSGPGGFGGTGSPGGFPGTGGPSSPNGSNRAGSTQPVGQPLPDGSTWRSSPNDELVRQAERTRQPSAGGVTTSGLPRRVPRANLVAGTAQEQQHQAGPQVSRAPDDVRGRLTNLRRGIQQGRQAGSGSPTGSFPSPTHQQER